MVKKQNRRGAVCVYPAIKNEIGYGACGINMGTFFSALWFDKTDDREEITVCLYEQNRGEKTLFHPHNEGNPPSDMKTVPPINK